MTTIAFERTGGIVSNEIHFEVDLNQLPADDAEHLHQLLLHADFFNIPKNLAATSTPDEFQYVITVDAGDESHTVRTSDTTMPKNLLPLVKELTMMKMLQ